MRALGAVILAGGLLAAECSETASPTDTPTPTPSNAVATVTVTPTGPVMLTAIGMTSQLQATARNSAGSAVTAIMTWTSSASGVATVSASGLVTAVGMGTASITASTSGKSGSVSVTVTVTPASITVTPTPVTLAKIGGTQALGAVAKDASNNTLSGIQFAWTSSAPAVATVDAATGVVTAVTNGSATITATASGVSGTASITVAQVVASVAVTPAAPAALTAVNATQQFTAAARDSNDNAVAGAAFTWTTSDASVGTVSATGLATAKANGSTTITATSGTKSGTATLTVAIAAQPVATITVTPSPTRLASIGATQQLTATAKDANGNDVSGVAFTWSTSNAGVAAVSAAGVTTAIANGAATVTATGGGKTGTVAVIVAQTVSTITVTPATATLTTYGATQQFTAQAKDAGGTAMTGVNMTWTSSTPVATISTSGLATAAAAGTTTITAAASGKTGTATLTVTVNPCDTRATLTLAAPHASGTLTTTDCSIGTQYPGTAGNADRGHVYGLNLTVAGRLEMLAISSAFNPVLQFRSTSGTTVLASDDATIGSIARFATAGSIAASTYKISIAGKTGQSGFYDLYVARMLTDLNGLQCPSLGLLSHTTTELFLDGELGDANGCGSGASNTSDIYQLANPFTAGKLHMTIEGRNATAVDRSFQPVIRLFYSDGTNLSNLPLDDPDNVRLSVCVDPNNPTGGWYKATFDTCDTSSSFQYRTINKGKGLYFVRITGAKLGQYKLRWRWVP